MHKAVYHDVLYLLVSFSTSKHPRPVRKVIRSNPREKTNPTKTKVRVKFDGFDYMSFNPAGHL